jgi:hypothetical protein
MATYESVGRTNYFAVRDAAALEELLSDSGIELVHEHGGRRVALIDGEGTDWTLRDDSAAVEYSEDDDGEIFLPDVIADHLTAGQVAVFQRVGREGMRYVVGEAIAVNATGDRVVVGLDDIYEQAAKQFGVDPASISSAAY